MILERIGLSNRFEVCVDGNQARFGKPNPEIFLKAAEQLTLRPTECLVIEDGLPGIKAACAAKMTVIGVGTAAQDKGAHYHFPDLAKISIATLSKILAGGHESND